MATEVIRQGSTPRDGARPARSSRAIERLRALGAKGIRMAQAAGRELAEDVAGGDGDGAAVDGKRVRLPSWLFIACILGAAEVGRLEQRLSTMSDHIAEDKAGHVAALAKATEEQQKALAEQRRAVDQDLQRLSRELSDEKERAQYLRESLIRKREL